MAYSITINTAGRGTPTPKGPSDFGHMWYSINDGSASNSFGFGPVEDEKWWNNGFGLGDVNVYGQDDTFYQGSRDSSITVGITKDQYDKLMAFGDDSGSLGFDQQYNGLSNSCIDFTWAALKHAGLYGGSFEGNLYPPMNANDIAAVLDGSNGVFESLLGNIYAPAEAQSLADAVFDVFAAAQRWITPPRRDPLTLDLNGNGLETVGAAESGVQFDHSGDGIKQGTGWVTPNDGFLVLDRNGNGTIDNGTELFGDSTVLADGSNAADGFDALAQEDTNADGVVNNLDANWNNLRIWQDLNQDGISQAGELSSLDQLGITSINAGSTQNSEVLANGNQIADLGTFTYTDGTTGNTGVSGDMADINLAVDTVNTSFVDSITLTAEAAALPGLQGSGMVRDIQQAASMITAEGITLTASLSQYAQATTPANDELILRLAA